MASLEHRIVCRAVCSRDIKPLLEAHVTPEWFGDEDEAEAFGFVRDHYVKYGEVPTRDLFLSEFPSYKLAAVEDSVDPLIDRLREQHRHNSLSVVFAEASDLMERFQTEEARTLLTRGLSELDADTSTSSDIDFNATWAERLDRYEEIGEGGGLLGIPTGFRTIDKATGGLQRGQLVTVIATPKVGKSTLMLKLAVNANVKGHRIMLVSFEMSHDEQAARYDAMVAGLAHQRILHGKLTKVDWARLEGAREVVERRPVFVEVEDSSRATTVSGLAAKIEQHSPDLCIVDGVYMMQDELGEAPGSPQALTNITRNLKRLASRADIPILESTQSLTWKISKGKGISADSIGYSSSFFQDSDVILGLQEVFDAQGKEVEDERLLRIVASRNCPKGEVNLLWDWTTSRFEELDADALEPSYGGGDE